MTNNATLEIPALVTASAVSIKWLEGVTGIALTIILIVYTCVKLYYLIKNKGK